MNSFSCKIGFESLIERRLQTIAYKLQTMENIASYRNDKTANQEFWAKPTTLKLQLAYAKTLLIRNYVRPK